MKATEKTRLERMSPLARGVAAFFLMLALGVASVREVRGELAPVTLAKWNMADLLANPDVPVPNATLREGKLFVVLPGIGGPQSREVVELAVRITAAGRAVYRKMSPAVRYLEERDGGCVFHLRSCLVEYLGPGGAENAEVVELTGSYDRFGKSPPPLPTGTRTVLNDLPWRVAFSMPEGLVLEPGESGSCEGNVTVQDTGSFRVHFDWKLERWQIQLANPQAWPIARMVWKGGAGNATSWEEFLPEEAILSPDSWNADLWGQGVVARKFGLNPAEYEGWRLEWSGTSPGTAIGDRTSCEVTWKQKPEAMAIVVNRGDYPIRWGTNAIPARTRIEIPWTEAEALRNTDAVVSPPPPGKKPDFFKVVIDGGWPVSPKTSRGDTNRIVCHAELKRPPAVLIFNDGDAEIQLKNTGIPAGKNWCYVRPDLPEGKELTLTFEIVPGIEQRARWNWPHKVDVPVVIPAWGATNEVHVVFSPTDKAPVTLVVTNPGPQSVVVGVDGFILEPGESEIQEIPWADAWGHIFDIRWEPTEKDRADWLPGSRKVQFNEPGGKRNVQCDLSRRPETVSVCNTGRIPLSVTFADKEPTTVSAGGTHVFQNIPPFEDGKALTVSFVPESASDVWSGGTLQWNGEPRVAIKAEIATDVVAAAVSNVVEGSKVLSACAEKEGVQEVRPLGLDETAFIQEGLERLCGCGLTEKDVNVTGGQLPDWNIVRTGVWYGLGEESKAWSLVKDSGSWDDFMAGGEGD